MLVEAGLGEQKIDIADVDCSPQDFHKQLIAALLQMLEGLRF